MHPLRLLSVLLIIAVSLVLPFIGRAEPDTDMGQLLLLDAGDATQGTLASNYSEAVLLSGIHWPTPSPG